MRIQVIAKPLENPRMKAFLVTIRPGGGSARAAPVVHRGEPIGATSVVALGYAR